jgi:glycosyltransferase involved in cell wall biosynthesis
MRIAAVVNMITPYSNPVFAAMAATPGVELLVVYETIAEPNRHWDLSKDVTFDHVVLDTHTFNLSRLAVGSGMKVVTDHYLHLPRRPLKALSDFKPDVVIAAGGGIWSSPADIAALAARARHDWGIVPWWGSFRRTAPTLPRRVAEPWVRHFMRACDAWIAYGTRSARDLEELGADPERIVIAPFAAPPRERVATERAYTGDPSGPHYLFVGQLIERKGIRQLLHAFAGLPTGQLWLVGDGPLRGDVERAAQADPRIRYFGHLPSDELDRLYATADVMVAPSLYEVWGLVVNEALEHGLPVIVTDQTGAADDLIFSGLTGEIVKAGSEEQLQAAMAEVGAWPADRRARCVSEAARLLDRWSIEAETAGFLRAAELAVEHRRAPRRSPTTSPGPGLRALAVIHYPVFGGPTNRYTKIGPLLAAAGVELTMLTTDEPGDATSRLREAGLDVVSQRLGRARAGRAVGPNARVLAALPRDVAAIRRLLRERSIDVVMVNGLVNPHAAIAARLEGVPVVWLLLDTYSSPRVRQLFRPIILRLADVIMSTGESVASAHLGAAPVGERLVLFFPPVDVDGAFAPSVERRRAARAELGVSDEELVVGNIANLTPMKGHMTFIRAAAELGATHPNTRFLVLGAAYDYRDEYTRSLHDEAERLGLADRLEFRDPGSRVADLSPAIDVFWMPSRPNSEGIPTAIGEAMSLEQPVIASRVGSIDEAVEDGVTGTLVAPDDAVSLAAATIPYLDDPALRWEAGRAGRERARRLYSPQACADAHIRALELAVKRPIREGAGIDDPMLKLKAAPPVTSVNGARAEPSRGTLERLVGHGRSGPVVGTGAAAWSFLDYNISSAGRESARRIREFRDAYKGRRCFIIGNGPSLRRMDLSPLRDEVTFGLNRIYLLFEELGFSTTFLVSINRLVLEQAAHEMTAVDSTVFLNWWSRHHVPPERDPIYLRVTSATPRFSMEVDRGIWAGATVTFSALQLAYYMGFEEAILIGVDHSFAGTGTPNAVVESYGPDRNHFSPSYFGKGFRWQLPDLETSEHAYQLARGAYERAGRRVLDATVDGKLEVFPKVEFASLFDPKKVG